MGRWLSLKVGLGKSLQAVLRLCFPVAQFFRGTHVNSAYHKVQCTLKVRRGVTEKASHGAEAMFIAMAWQQVSMSFQVLAEKHNKPTTSNVTANKPCNYHLVPLHIIHWLFPLPCNTHWSVQLIDTCTKRISCIPVSKIWWIEQTDKRTARGSIIATMSQALHSKLKPLMEPLWALDNNKVHNHFISKSHGQRSLL